MVQVSAGTISEIFEAVTALHPGFTARLMDDQGAMHKFVNVFVDDEDVRYLSGLATSVSPGQVVSIVPAVAGGSVRGTILQA